VINLSKVFSQFCIVLMKRQFVVTHTIRQTGIPALLDSWVTNTPSKIMCKQNLFFVKKNSLIFFSVSCKKLCICGLRQIAVLREIMVMIIMFVYCRYISVVANILTVHCIIKIIL